MQPNRNYLTDNGLSKAMAGAMRSRPRFQSVQAPGLMTGSNGAVMVPSGEPIGGIDFPPAGGGNPPTTAPFPTLGGTPRPVLPGNDPILNHPPYQYDPRYTQPTGGLNIDADGPNAGLGYHPPNTTGGGVYGGYTSPLGSNYFFNSATGSWVNSSSGFPRATSVNPNNDPYGLSGGGIGGIGGSGYGSAGQASMAGFGSTGGGLNRLELPAILTN